jgi:biotin transport system substrate-specific component
MATMASRTGAFPASLQSATFTRGRILPVAIGTLFLATSSWISVPMVPVPVTMQTYAVIVIGALMGTRMGVVTVTAWLAEAALGLPVLAQGGAGLHVFFGPTAGYILSFPVIAALTGWLADRKLDSGILRSLGSMLAANAINLALGVFWLATFLGWHRAVLAGFMPFWIGGLLKAGLATATITLARKQMEKSSRAS